MNSIMAAAPRHDAAAFLDWDARSVSRRRQRPGLPANSLLANGLTIVPEHLQRGSCRIEAGVAGASCKAPIWKTRRTSVVLASRR